MKISIPKPCSENWNEMTPEQQGAFCKVCSKVVVDFSNMSDEEVISYFEKKKEEKTCGRFRISQLSPYELKINLRSIAAQKSFRKIFAASLFIFFSSLFICKSDTGEPVMFNVVPVDTIDTSSLVLRLDSASNNFNNTSVAEIDSANKYPIVMGGAVATTQVKTTDTTTLTADTTVAPMMVGEVVIPAHQMLMGKIACTKPLQQKQKQNERKTKGEVRIMGNLEF